MTKLFTIVYLSFFRTDKTLDKNAGRGSWTFLQTVQTNGGEECQQQLTLQKTEFPTGVCRRQQLALQKMEFPTGVCRQQPQPQQTYQKQFPALVSSHGQTSDHHDEIK